MCRKNIELYLALVLPGPRQWTALIVGLHPPKKSIMENHSTHDHPVQCMNTSKKVEGLGLYTFN